MELNNMVNENITLHSSAQARGERVRRVRNMANLSRPALCEKSDFKIDTLIGWEVARHGGLTEKGAQKLIHRVAQEGVICTVEWLLHGTGLGPTVIADDAINQVNDAFSIIDDEEKKIAAELQLFKKHYCDAIEFRIQDNSMSPNYNVGDYVAGIKCPQDKWHMIIGHDCIVQLLNGIRIVRKVLIGEETNKYTLVAANLNSEASYIILSNAAISYAARVIWHRRKII